MEDACGKYGGEVRCINVYVGKPEEKLPLGLKVLEREVNIIT